jgi:hypothetical protein
MPELLRLQGAKVNGFAPNASATSKSITLLYPALPADDHRTKHRATIGQFTRATQNSTCFSKAGACRGTSASSTLTITPATGWWTQYSRQLRPAPRSSALE